MQQMVGKKEDLISLTIAETDLQGEQNISSSYWGKGNLATKTAVVMKQPNIVVGQIG
jgi:hypothetical protein